MCLIVLILLLSVSRTTFFVHSECYLIHPLLATLLPASEKLRALVRVGGFREELKTLKHQFIESKELRSAGNREGALPAGE